MDLGSNLAEATIGFLLQSFSVIEELIEQFGISKRYDIIWKAICSLLKPLNGIQLHFIICDAWC